ncbi:MAG: glycosyltransferase family 2 protein, partial [Phycisphaeraceae bacterium]
VVNYNGGQRLVNTIEALVNQPFPLERIVLCDNSSTDGAPDQVRERFPEVCVCDLGGNHGPCVARNEGVQRVRSSLVLLLDNDVYVQPNTIEKLVEAWRRTGAAIVCPRVRLLPERDTVQSDGADIHCVGLLRMRHAWTRQNDLPADAAARREVGGAISACLLVDRGMYERVGGFDELYFFYFEDLEFSVRTRLLGGAVVCEPAVEVLHDRGEGTVGLSFRGSERTYPKRRAYLLQRNRRLTILTHYRLRTIVVLLPALALYELAGFAMAVRKRFVIEWLRSWWWVIPNAGAWWQRRRRMQRERVIRDRELLTGGPLPFSPGFLQGRAAAAMGNLVSGTIAGYWIVVRRLIG